MYELFVVCITHPNGVPATYHNIYEHEDMYLWYPLRLDDATDALHRIWNGTY